LNSVHGILTPEDQNRLRRLFSRMLGRNFKLAIVETRFPMQRQHVIEWFGEQLPQAHFFEVDLGKLSGGNLWSALTEHLAWSDIPHKAILLFYGLENAKGGTLERPDIFQQLNVQRDLFVRDFPVPWLFFVHPESRQELNRVAPDFCDFAAVWVETTAKHEDNPGYQPELFNPELAILPDLSNYLTHPLLREAWSAFQQKRYQQKKSGRKSQDTHSLAFVKFWKDKTKVSTQTSQS